MRVTREEVEKIAALAKLEITEEEKEMFRGQLDRILDYVQKLNELDTKNVEPTYSVSHAGETLREDCVIPSMPREEALMNAPAQAHGFFRVPKIISKG